MYLKIFANPNPIRTVSRKSAGSLTRMFISIYIINLYIERGRGRERGREGESQTSVTLFCGFKQLGAPVVEAVSRQHTKWLTIFLLWLLIFLCIYHVYVCDLYLFVCLFVCLFACLFVCLCVSELGFFFFASFVFVRLYLAIYICCVCVRYSSCPFFLQTLHLLERNVWNHSFYTREYQSSVWLVCCL